MFGNETTGRGKERKEGKRGRRENDAGTGWPEAARIGTKPGHGTGAEQQSRREKRREAESASAEGGWQLHVSGGQF